MRIKRPKNYSDEEWQEILDEINPYLYEPIKEVKRKNKSKERNKYKHEKNTKHKGKS